MNECFVIMPFGGYFDSYYKEIYDPAIRDADLIPRRADDIFRTGVIIKDIWELTQNAKIVLADLTGRNANVMYELGLAHAIAKPTVMIAEDINIDVPFDLKNLRVISFNKNLPKWDDFLKENITQAIIETLAAPDDSILPAFFRTTPNKTTPEVSQTQKDMMELKHEVNSLRFEIRSLVNKENNNSFYGLPISEFVRQELSRKPQYGLSELVSAAQKKNKQSTNATGIPSPAQQSDKAKDD